MGAAQQRDGLCNIAYNTATIINKQKKSFLHLNEKNGYITYRSLFSWRQPLLKYSHWQQLSFLSYSSNSMDDLYFYPFLVYSVILFLTGLNLPSTSPRP